MNKKLLSEYAVLESEFRLIEAQREKMRLRIVAEFEKDKIEKVEDPTYGLFTVGRRLSWKYTEAVKKIEERLKIAKTKEQQKGLATSSETSYLVFTPKLGE